MGLDQSLRQLDTSVSDGDFTISIKFNRLERQFDDRNRLLVLYSDVNYTADDFEWHSTLPVVNIPYRDPSLGFMVEGVIFSSVGVYSRAPGIVSDVDRRVLKEKTVEEPKIDIVTARNSTISIGYKRNAVQVLFKRNAGDHKVPIGVFLKALSGLPYSEILKNFAYTPQMLLNGFPCSIPKGGEDLSLVETYGVESMEEPTIGECVDAVYSAITQTRADGKKLDYNTHWKTSRINSLLNSLHFKTRQKFEATLAIGNRAVGTYLEQELKVPYFKRETVTKQRLRKDGSKEEVTEVVESIDYYHLPKGHYITDDDAREIRRRDISTLRVKTTRSFVLQEQSPMFFRAKGYKLVNDIPEAGGHVGDIIDDDLLARINGTQMAYLDVFTPEGRKVLHRSTENVELGDFYTILNYLFTHVYTKRADTTQYEIGNRVIFDYDRQVRMEVEQVYNDIVSAISGCTELKSLLASFPSLPSNRLITYLRSSRNREITQSDITNIMSRAISETKASAGMRETPAEMMPVQKGQYGRIDSFHAPDSDKVGSVQQCTVLSRLNSETSEIEAPYEKIVDGRPTGRIVYLTAAKENNKYIVAWNETLENDVVMAMYNGEVTTVSREKVDYRDPSPFCDMSVSRMCIPFPGFSQPKRALMATKMNGQAIPVLFPERPMVSTGADTEVPGLYFTARMILQECGITPAEGKPLELVGREWRKHLVDYRFIHNGEALSFSLPFTATDKESLYHYNLNLIGGKEYNLDDVVFYNQNCDINNYNFWTRIQQGTLPLFKDHTKPAMALGVNLTVCIKTYGSSTVDDALLINERLITDNTLSNIQVFKYEYKLRQNESFPELGWGAPLHSHVYKGQPVIKISRWRETKGSIGREVLAEQEGEVVYSAKNDSTKEVEIWVATLHHAEVGDKMAGRYGDKSVIAKIVPDWMMPYDPDTGETVDVVLSPLGMPSRMNYGRILEIALGAVMSKRGERSVITPFYPDIKKDVVDLYNSEGMAPKRLFNPVYGKLTERPVMVGKLYMMKLEQMSNLKITAVGYPTAVDPVFGQPVESINTSKGQAIGEMESWALGAAGATKILNALYSVYSDDEEARREWFHAMGESDDTPLNPWDESMVEGASHSINKNALVTQTVMRMFGCDVVVKDNKYVLAPLIPSDIPVRITQQEFTSGSEKTKDYEWFTVPLAAPVINPFWICNFPLNIVLGVKSVKTLAAKTAYLDLNLLNNRKECIIPASGVPDYAKMHVVTGAEAIIVLVKNTTIDSAIARIKAEYGSAPVAALNDDGTPVQIDFVGVLDSLDDYDAENDLGNLADVPMGVADVLRFLYQMRKDGRELRDLIWYEMPIMPRIFRQNNIVGDREQAHSFQTQLKAICSSRATSTSIYDSLKDLIGYGTSKQENLISIRGYFFGKGSQPGNHGRVRGSVLSKRVGFSGRVVIVPMSDPTVSPFFVCLPWRVVMVELGKLLATRLMMHIDYVANRILSMTDLSYEAVLTLTAKDWQKMIESLGEFNLYVLGQYFPKATEEDLYCIYNILRAEIRGYVEGDVTSDGLVWYAPQGEYVDPATLPEDATIDCAVVLVGRQPTLHKKSIRSYFIKLVDGYCMEIHPVVCSGYNADFDGDQMYHVQLLGEGKRESFDTISVMQDLISEKDGSYTLDISQDVALGIYCATTFKDNASKWIGQKGHYYFFDNLDELRAQLEFGDLHYYDAVVYYCAENDAYYCSTAGRILINGSVPGCFTMIPFSDPHGICATVLGEEHISDFKSLLHDEVWTTTGIRPDGREQAVKVADVLLNTYDDYGARKSIMTTQALYEVGLAASDIYSVTMSLDDMSSSVDKEAYMAGPRNEAARLNDLYRLGLITDESRRMASVHAWDRAKKSAQSDIIGSLKPSSNTFYMMYSGARGKPDQVMQSVGFIGNIAKSKTEDIEYPILRGYGEGLSSFDLAQTRQSARIGVISAQAGTKDTGYATRQSVYMTSGLDIKADDCGIGMRVIPVEFKFGDLCVRHADGSVSLMAKLVGEFIDPSTEGFDLVRARLNASGYMVTSHVLLTLVKAGVKSITLLDEKVDILYSLSDEWRRNMLEYYYSYALPFTHEMKITEQTLDWIEANGLQEIVAFRDFEYEAGDFFDQEAYLPVDYDTSRYSITLDGQPMSEEALYTLEVAEDSPGLHYYVNLLTSTKGLTERAVKYLTKKRIAEVWFKGGKVARFRYEISSLFKNVVEGRQSAGLPHLSGDKCITKETIKAIEDCQLQYIPVRTGMTCLSKKGVCSCCFGKSLSTREFSPVGRNLGIAASQAMCEPLSQATLNVGHSGGKRSAGTGLVSGLDYYKRMMKGSMITERTAAMVEKFASVSGYVWQNKHNKNFVQIVGDDGKTENISLEDESRLNVPDGAYVDVNDTIVSGLPDLSRYCTTDVFDSALRTRYLLLKEYNKVFAALNVSARNAEIMARAQTSICYAVGDGAPTKTKDTAEEAAIPTGQYMLRVSNQAQVVSYFSGVASYGFENVANMLLMWMFTPEGLGLDSVLSNLITGTPVGSTKAEFLAKHGAGSPTAYHRSNVRERTQALGDIEHQQEFVVQLALTESEKSGGYNFGAEGEIMALLSSGPAESLPGFDAPEFMQLEGGDPSAVEPEVDAMPWDVEVITNTDEEEEAEVVSATEVIDGTVIDVEYVTADDEEEVKDEGGSPSLFDGPSASSMNIRGD